jgi:hypothetical protein
MVGLIAPVRTTLVGSPGKPRSATVVVFQLAGGEVLDQSTGLTSQLPTWQLTWSGPTGQSLWVDSGWVQLVLVLLVQIPENY